MRYDIREAGGIQEGELQEAASRLTPYIEELCRNVHARRYDVPEAALSTPFDEQYLTWADEVVKTLGTVEHVVLIGIGGSSAGTEAVYGALRTSASPDLHVLDMMDAERVRDVVAIAKRVPLEKLAIVIISKSGSTTETLANADVVLTALSNNFGGAIYRRTVCIGDSETPLSQYARSHKMSYVEMPKEVGGRYSVFTPVGLVPLALLGINVHDFILGAAKGVEAELKHDAEAARSASFLFKLSERNKRVHVLFPEDPKLHGFVMWYEQLLAESLGKKQKKSGEEIHAGILPVPMSPKELHSTAQLYLSGFPHIATTFFMSMTQTGGLSLSKDGVASLIKLPGSRLYERIPAAIMEGVRAAYKNEHLPHAVTDVGELTAENLGYLMAAKMLETMYVANLLGIDAFDQPNVELYKKETRRILDSQT